ncbi:MAG TPA: hypothetical protein VGO53_11635 [Steroidobacteraceae bacterium]|nr:hypothetical protein [Steroidobacteraceae bacterium]
MHDSLVRKVVLGGAVASIALLAGACSLVAPTPARAAANVKCTMSFSTSGWSAFYKTATGTGTVTCDNGQSMKVKLSAKGGGLTVGKSTIEDGHGEFSAVTGISEVLGSYVASEAHAGAVQSTGAQAMTKGEVSLALSGKGRGWDLGIAFGRFTISKG